MKDWLCLRCDAEFGQSRKIPCPECGSYNVVVVNDGEAQVPSPELHPSEMMTYTDENPEQKNPFTADKPMGEEKRMLDSLENFCLIGEATNMGWEQVFQAITKAQVNGDLND